MQLKGRSWTLLRNTWAKTSILRFRLVRDKQWYMYPHDGVIAQKVAGQTGIVVSEDSSWKR